MTTSIKKTFLITGCSSGLGAAIAKAALKEGHFVLATARDQDGLPAKTRLKELSDAGAETGHLDVTESMEEVTNNIARIVAKAPNKTVDILINNAGFLLLGGVEECSSKEIFNQFDVNVFGAVRVLQAVLPLMRAQRSGVIAMLGSLGGWQGYPGSGFYSATKASCSLLAEALRGEVSHLGISVTSIEPGRFRTAFLTEGTARQSATKSIADLDPVMSEVRKYLQAGDQQQPGNPVKAANIIVEVLTFSGKYKDQTLPHRLVLGPDAISVIKESMAHMADVMESWHDVSSSTDF